jgi:MYXO-CTERM domain-containing protein
LPVRRTTAQPGWRAGYRRVLRRVQSIGEQFPALLEQEASHGHGFLFVPVLIGAGAATSFEMAQDPPFWPYVVALAVFAAAAFLARRRIPSFSAACCSQRWK